MSDGAVVWFTGLPASGKSALAKAVAERLRGRGTPAVVLDSDELRNALAPTAGYSPEGRDAFYQTMARLAALLAGEGLVVLVAATANLRAYRERARALAPRYVEVFVDVSVEECARRDPKGLYAAASAGKIRDLPGVGAPYERPESPDVVATGGRDEEAVERIVELVK